MVDKITGNIQLTSGKFEKEKEYWVNKLKGLQDISCFPEDTKIYIQESNQREKYRYEFSSEISEKIRSISNHSDTLMYIILLSGVNYLLNRYSGDSDICTCMPVYKQKVEADLLINKFVPLRIQINLDDTFKELVVKIREVIKEASNHQNFPMDRFLENLDQEVNYHSIFNTIVLLEPIHEKEYINNFKRNIVFSFDTTRENIAVSIDYDMDKYRKETIKRFLSHLLIYFETAIANPNIKLFDIDILSEHEKLQLTQEFNRTQTEYQEHKTVVQLFHEQVERNPKLIAAVFNGQEITYGELNSKANQLARKLRKLGVGNESIIGLMMERSIDLVVSILGIVKAGGAYLPIDPELPSSRIELILEDSGSSMLLTKGNLLKNICLSKDKIVNFDNINFAEEESNNLKIVTTPKDLAYVIYTSGSTGRPKGVMVEHKSLNNFTFSMFNKYKQNIGPNDKCLVSTSISFDVSIFEIFLPLLYGARLVVFGGEKLNIEHLMQTIINESVTLSYIPPGLLNEVYEYLAEKKCKVNLNKILVGVEPIKESLLAKYHELFDGDLQILNGYGPTEATVCCTVYEYQYSQERTINSVPIGSPLCNTKIEILDRYNRRQPIGVVGELCISGDGLARGYIHNSELIKPGFVKHPLVSAERMYKTGDQARWLPDGNIEYVGRLDDQVKLRGYRIELGEIESVILNFESVKKVKVILREDQKGHKFLSAYIVSDEVFSNSELREYLLIYLPEYMLPSHFISLEEMPLTTNGKVDKKRLPESGDQKNTDHEYVPPKNNIEQKLMEYCEEVLGIENIGTHHNFLELGGHSLHAAKLVARLNKIFNIELPITIVFKYPVLKDLAQYIEETDSVIHLSIEPAEEKSFYPVTSAQKSLLILNELEGIGTSYNMPVMLNMEGQLNIERFNNATNLLIKRHESLRTSFEWVNGEPVQRVHNEVDFNIKYMHLNDLPLEEIIHQFIQSFNLQEAPLLRIGLATLSQNKYLLMLDIHHIISDEISMRVLIDEFIALYKGESLSPLRLQYKDFSVWQNDQFEKGGLKAAEEYWLKSLDNGEYTSLELPTDYPRPSSFNFEGDIVTFSFEQELTQQLKKLANESETTIYALLLAIYNVLLHKSANQEEIIVGTLVSGRTKIDVERIVGMFANFLAVRNFPNSTKTFRQFLSEVKESSINAQANQHYPFEKLVDKLGLSGETNRNPIFNTLFSLQNLNLSEMKIDGLKISPYKYDEQMSKLDLSLFGTEGENKLNFDLVYSTMLFKRETVERLANRYIAIAKEIIRNPDIKLSEIDIIPESEKRKLLDTFNDTKADYPSHKTIHELFEDQVKMHPENIAVVCNKQEITYQELNARANQLARRLREQGVNLESIVGIMMEHSIEMIVGILGVLKAGGAYLPIDPEYPEDRIMYMLNDSDLKVLVTQENLIEKTKFSGVMIDINQGDINQEDTSNLEQIVSPTSLAYIIYTSGTTGQPKGVMIEHRNVVRLLFNDKMLFDFNEMDSWTMFHSFCFDFSVWEMYGALLYGGKLIVVPKPIAQDPKKYIKLLLEHKVTVVNQTPAAFSLLINEELTRNEKGLSIRYVIFGGEALRPGMLIEWKRKYPDTKLINMYGITETTVHVTYKEITEYDIENGISNIGTPLPTLTTYIFDQDKKMVPIGVSGELYVGGDGVARGYLNKLDLTATRFITNPYIKGERLYKTGDIARWLSDGNLEYLGRMDHQVKIRGYRIELGEIEFELLKYHTIKDAFVMDREDEDGMRYLCAYLISEAEIDTSEIRKHLSEKLPNYMIPAYFIQIDQMPLTSNGKINRALIPKPKDSIRFKADYIPPRNDMERELIRIWEDVLGIQQIGITDNFFELGGHSLKAAVLISRINKKFNVEMSIQDIFKYPNFSDLYHGIQDMEKNDYIQIQPAEERVFYPTSSAQKRMFILEQFDEVNTTYNIPVVLKINGRLDIKRLEYVFKTLILRHEAFRTTFEIVNGEPVQKVHHDISFTIDYFEAGEDVDKQVNEFIKPFNLMLAPLLRVGLIKVNKDEHVMIIDMHHIISDGVSMGILIKEFVEIYKGGTLPELRVQYKDFVVWQDKFHNSEVLKKQKEYWLRTIAGEAPLLNMPTDYQRPTVQSFEGDELEFAIGSELTLAIKKLADETNTTLFMILIAMYNVLLSKYCEQEDIIVGSPIAARTHSDTEQMIGMFVNTLALRNYPNSSKTFISFLEQVKENTIEAYANQSYPFEKLIDDLELRRDTSRNPLFDTMFVLQNMDMDTISLKELAFSHYHFKQTISKFDLSLIATEVSNDIHFKLEYSTKLFKKETIERFILHFKSLVKEIVQHPYSELMDLKMLSPEEEDQILTVFNRTDSEYLYKSAIHEIFELQVEKNPNKIAVTCDGIELTYEQLNARANQLARILKKQGIVTESIIGLMMESSIDMIVGILGILKAGAAYLPIDVDLPSQRIEYMLEDSGCRTLLINESFSNNEIVFEGNVLNLNEMHLEVECLDNLQLSISSENIVYVIYTSGSTGNPKGVMIEHQSLNNFLTAMYQGFNEDIGPTDNVLSATSISFDVSVFEIFIPLVHGARLTIYKGERFDVNQLIQVMKNQSITLSYIPPSLLNEIYDILVRSDNKINLNKLLVGVEPIKADLLEKYTRLFNGNLQIINGYGPTESTICCTFYKYNDLESVTSKNVPIGSPLANTKVYILDHNNRIQPIGLPGELCVSGLGLARGYINKEDLTAEKFVESPIDSNQRLYRTGDIARWLPDGNIEFLGRKDRQVKLRGYRIELGEIEAQLLKNEYIRETVVIDSEDGDDKYLSAYIISDRNFISMELRSYLSNKLPEYMIPAYFISIDKIPLTSNGKTDRKALPKPNKVLSKKMSYVAPRNEIEEQLVTIWEEVLNVERVGITDNFFELGGHSIKGIKIMDQVRITFNLQLPLGMLFQKSTIEEMSEVIRSNKRMQGECLFTIQKGNSTNTPWFIVHGQGGGILNFHQLTKTLGQDETVYGLQSVGYETNEDPIQSIEEMAALYIKQIRQVKENGPYRLIGWSFGGVVVYEMAKVLEQEGETIEFLGMLDVHPPEQGKEIEITSQEQDDSLFDLALKVGIKDNILDNLSEVEGLTLILNCIKNKKTVDNEIVVDSMINKLKIMVANRLAYINYECSGRINTDTYLFNATETDTHPLVDSRGWKKHTLGNVYSFSVPGTHYTMLNAPNHYELAKSIKVALSKKNSI